MIVNDVIHSIQMPLTKRTDLYGVAFEEGKPMNIHFVFTSHLI